MCRSRANRIMWLLRSVSNFSPHFRPVAKTLRMFLGKCGKRLHNLPTTMHGNPSTFYNIKVGLISQLHSFLSVSVAQFHGSDVLFQFGWIVKSVKTTVSFCKNMKEYLRFFFFSRDSVVRRKGFVKCFCWSELLKHEIKWVEKCELLSSGINKRQIFYAWLVKSWGND